jgi:predicted amidohydrolase
MSKNVRISTVAPRPPTERPAPNQAAVERMIALWEERLAQVLPQQPDLILLPEACDRYPAHSQEERWAYYHQRGDQLRDRLAEIARAHHCLIGYSAARELPDGTWRNSTQLLGRDGALIGVYNKHHLVITEMEAGLLGGAEMPVFETDLGRIVCAICFDLNFDGLLRHYAAAQPDLILFSSMYHGGLMQPYWAYTCRAHMVTAVAGLPSGILNPVGVPVATSTNYFDHVTATVNLDCQVVHLDLNWEKLAAMQKKYGPGVTVHDPGYLGAVLITSEMEAPTSAELVREFGIELLDDYWARSLAAQDALGRRESSGA